ncbi:hypothetical protein SUGI_0021530 [Cryptomeria japonica]|nr:hypothetical protein SUGI_0021530 [Cryptomeria japonica]
MASIDRPSDQERDLSSKLQEKSTHKIPFPDTLRTVIKYDGDDVDKSAEKFIAKFRHDLEIERQKSLELYKEMLDRGI